MKKILPVLLSLLLLFSIPLQAVELVEIEYVNINSRFATVVELGPSENKVLLSKNANAKIYPASMTKIMTVYLAISKIEDLNQKTTVLQEDIDNLYEAGASVANLWVGQEITILDALYGAMLPSGADATNVLARIASGNLTNFIQEMNDLAQQLGMKDTHFVNASGLYDKNHYTTLNDLVLLLSHAMKNDVFKTIFSTLDYTFPDTEHLVRSTLYGYAQEFPEALQYIQGGKTGWVYESGYCLASYSTYLGKTFIIVTADAYDYGNNVLDHHLLYKFMFESTHTLPVLTKEQFLFNTPVKYAHSENTNIYALEDETVTLPVVISETDFNYQYTQTPDLIAPIEQGQVMGKLQLDVNGEVVFEKEFVNQKQIQRDFGLFLLTGFIEFFSQPQTQKIAIGLVVFLIILLLSLFFIARNNRRKRKRQGYKGYRY